MARDPTIQEVVTRTRDNGNMSGKAVWTLTADYGRWAMGYKPVNVGHDAQAQLGL